jgi:hypothetical protein
MKYSIVIPTYERTENLTIILGRLVEAVSERTQVLIVTEPNSNSLPHVNIIKRWSHKLEIKIHINKCKTGVDESILRAYEHCDSEWIYFLGDSKLPYLDFESVLKSAHQACPDACAYFFSYDSTLKGDLRIDSIEALVKSGFRLGDFILGGNSVFSRKIVEKYIAYSYRVLSSRIAHVAMPLMALSRREPIFIARAKIIDKYIEKPSTYQPGKALLDCWASFALLVLLPIERGSAKDINKYVLQNERFSQLSNFCKYCLLKVFRDKIPISKDLKTILRFRYIYQSKRLEKAIVWGLYMLARSIEVLRGK